MTTECKSHPFKLLLVLCLSSLAIASANPAHATIYSVGAGTDCTHSSLMAALGAAVADASPGPHLIRLDNVSRIIQNYEINNPVADIIIRGGHSSCSQSQPDPGQRSTLTSNDTNGTRVLSINNHSDNPRRTITLERVTLTGGNNPPGLGWGGAVLAQGKVTLVLANETRIQENQAVNGGGIALLGLSTGTELETRLQIEPGVQVSLNQAVGGGSNGNGGGIYALGNTLIRLRGGMIAGNAARRHGGGIALDSDLVRLSLEPFGETGFIAISENDAGFDGHSQTLGFGGGIYLNGGHIEFPAGSTPSGRPGIGLVLNSANYGGAIYADGKSESGTGFATVRLHNPSIVWNTARGRGGAFYLNNAVDLIVAHFGFQSCFSGGALMMCANIWSNSSTNTGYSSTFGSGPVAFLNHDKSADRPALRIAGARIQSNSDPNGTTATIDARGQSSVRILRSVLVGNTAGGEPFWRSLIESRRSMLFAFNTVLDNDVANLLLIPTGTEANVSGSVLYNPGAGLVYPGEGTLVHNGCLLAHTDIGIPPGDGVITGQSPRLDSSFRPLAGSPVIDVCHQSMADNFWPDWLDGIGQVVPIGILPADQQVLGPYDLGAIEASDGLFRDRFQN
jgi:hypothetical protein